MITMNQSTRPFSSISLIPLYISLFYCSCIHTLYGSSLPIGKRQYYPVRNGLFQHFILRHDFTHQVLLHHQSSDGDGICSPESPVLHNDGDGHLRIILRGETDKKRVIFAVRVFSGTGFATNGKVGFHVCPAASSVSDGIRHSLYCQFKMFGEDVRLPPLAVKRVRGCTFPCFYHVWLVVVPPIGYDGRIIGKLKGSSQYLSLTDGNGDDVVRHPPVGLERV